MSEQADQLERFRQEARAVAKLSHPNVVSVIDAGEDGGYPYIVFEYVEGETLKQRITRVGALDTQEALAYAIEIARGLTVAHARKMVHRDIKPQNVLIDAEGRAKLTDFGISRQLEQDGMTATGRVLGTTDYVAPEQAMGHGVDPRSDIYSLGVVLYEMLIGQVPFHADSQVGVAMKHVNEELPDVQARRPETLRGGGAGGRAGDRQGPGRALPDVGEMIDDLSTALEVEAARAGSTTGEATSVLDAVPPPKRKLSGRGALVLGGDRRCWSLVAGGGRWSLIQLDSSGDTPVVGNGGGGTRRTTGSPVAISTRPPTTTPRATAKRNPARSNSRSTATRPGPPGATEHYDTDTFAGTKTGPDPGVGIYVTTEGGGHADEDGDPHPDPGLGRRRSSPPPPGPPDELDEWGEPVGEVSDADKPRKKSTSHLGRARQVLPDLVQQGARRRATRKGASRSRSATSSCSTEGPRGGLRTRRSGRGWWRSTASATRRSQRSG